MSSLAFLQTTWAGFAHSPSPLLLHCRASRRPRLLPVQLQNPRRCKVPYASSERSSPSPDYYQILDVSDDADAASIKRAYRRAALKNHPDVSNAPDARERFLLVQEAYNVLSDASKRTTYDRHRRAAAAGSSPFAGFGDFGNVDNAASEYARRWREKNPMPEDINDSFGSIFSDLFSGVADAFGSGVSSGSGVVEDFIQFLEKRVDGFNSSSPPSMESDDVLRSSDEDVLRAEIDDVRFVIDQLQQRKRKAQNEENNLRKRAREWSDRANRAEKSREYDVKVAAREREDELLKQANRFASRVSESSAIIRTQEDRLRRLKIRLDKVRADSRKHPVSGNNNVISDQVSKSSNSRPQSPTSQKEAIDEELERMKKELGL